MTGATLSSANSINDLGMVVGISGGASINTTATFWDSITNSPAALDPLTGNTNSFASSINNSGIVVGYSSNATGTDRVATLWDANGLANDLNTMLDGTGSGWVLQWALDINNAGQIVGYGRKDGVYTSFLLTPNVAPVPIPAALPLLLSALGFFGFLGWRRKRLATA